MSRCLEVGRMNLSLDKQETLTSNSGASADVGSRLKSESS